MQSNDLRLLNVSCVLSLVFVLFCLGTVVIGRPFRDFTIYEVYFIGLIFINCLYLRVDLDTIISEFPFFRLLSQVVLFAEAITPFFNLFFYGT